MDKNTTPIEGPAGGGVEIVRTLVEAVGLRVGVDSLGVASAGKTYIGFDNGTSAGIGIVTTRGRAEYFPVPSVMEQSYTKKKQRISRIDWRALQTILAQIGTPSLAVCERPCVNPGRFKTTLSAMRALESELCLLERLGIPAMYVDSREWQKVMLPSGYKGPELKVISREIGYRLFPALKDAIDEVGDADGLLLAEFARRKQL